MNFELPQIIYLVLTFLGMGITLARHGQPRKENYDFGVSLVTNGLLIGLLVWGGFFK